MNALLRHTDTSEHVDWMNDRFTIQLYRNGKEEDFYCRNPHHLCEVVHCINLTDVVFGFQAHYIDVAVELTTKNYIYSKDSWFNWPYISPFNIPGQTCSGREARICQQHYLMILQEVESFNQKHKFPIAQTASNMTLGILTEHTFLPIVLISLIRQYIF